MSLASSSARIVLGDRLAYARFGFVLAVAAGVGGCAGLRTEPLTTPAASELPGLEAVVEADSTDLTAVTRLALGYVSASRFADARALLMNALDRAPGDDGVLLMLALMEERLGDEEASAARYASYLSGSPGPFRPMAAAHFERVRAPGLRAELARRVADLDVPGFVELDPDRLAVLPFVDERGDPNVADGLTWLLARDLDEGRYQVVDRALVAAVLEASDLAGEAASGLTAAERVMRLTRAGHVVQGTIRPGSGGAVTWDVTVVTALGQGRFDIASLPAAGRREALPALTERVASAVRMVVRGARVSEVPDGSVSSPESMDALTAFVRGVRATEEDDWLGSLELFGRASELEPSFEEAGPWRRRAEAVVRFMSIPLPEAMEDVARAAESWRSVVALRGAPSSSFQEALSRAGDEPRAAASEILGLDYVGASTPLTIVFEGTEAGGP